MRGELKNNSSKLIREGSCILVVCISKFGPLREPESSYSSQTSLGIS